MKTPRLNFNSLSTIHPFVLFWMGVLTGAIIVGLVFLYRQNVDLQDSIIRSTKPPVKKTLQQAPKNVQSVPQSNQSALPGPTPTLPGPTPTLQQ